MSAHPLALWGINDLRTGLSYGDVFLVPKRSPVDSRDDVDLSTTFTPAIRLETPLVSAAMDTVTEAEMAVELGRAGGLGVPRRSRELRSRDPTRTRRFGT